ncbi:hypothetical protein V6U90_28170 [Micromonospora sp. CPCC 206060]|uniref:hypothetical protein n=1 Tax=Micromonospora sp. CPCC 206060 TaxID=3122406 RepID=UPI002FF1BE40
MSTATSANRPAGLQIAALFSTSHEPQPVQTDRIGTRPLVVDPFAVPEVAGPAGEDPVSADRGDSGR